MAISNIYVGSENGAKQAKKVYVPAPDNKSLLLWEKPSYKIVSFENGTDEEIAAMLEAYYNDELSWEDMGWNVGDTRLIHLNQMQAPNPNSSNTWAAQDITVVIVAHEQTDLVTPINGHTKACITVQTRECMNNNTSNYNQAGHIHINGDRSYDITFTPWVNLYMRTYLNDKVYGAITYSKTTSGTALGSNTSFKSMIKKSKHNRHNTYNGTTVTSPMVEDNLFLPSYPEIYGTASFSNYVATSPVEGTQFPYYATASNRIKYGNNNGVSNGTTQHWWNGSVSSFFNSSYGYRWCRVVDDGSSSDSYGEAARGLAPAAAM